MTTKKGTALRWVLTVLFLFILGGLVVLVVKDHLTRAERERREEPRTERQSVPPSATPQRGEERAEELPSESKERQPIAGVAGESARDSKGEEREQEYKEAAQQHPLGIAGETYTPEVGGEARAPANLRKGGGIVEYTDGTTQEFFGFYFFYGEGEFSWSVPYRNTTRKVPLAIVKTITVGPREGPKSDCYEVDIETTTGFTFTFAEHGIRVCGPVIVVLDDEITGTRKDQKVGLSVIRRVKLVR